MLSHLLALALSTSSPGLTPLSPPPPRFYNFSNMVIHGTYRFCPGIPLDDQEAPLLDAPNLLDDARRRGDVLIAPAPME